MKVTFVLPQWWLRPIGGYAVVYGHADGLVQRGHEVTVLLGRPPQENLREEVERREREGEPLVGWRPVDPRVRLQLVDAVDDASVPDGDVVIATSAGTVASVMALAASKGRKHQLVGGYETWMTAPDVLDASWRAPTTKLVVSHYLLEIGRRLGAPGLRHLPGAVDHDRFQLRNPPETRPPRVLTLHHHDPVKGWANALPVLERFHQARPDVPVAVFGTRPRPDELPAWAEHHRDPADLGALYNSASVYVAASLNEGFGLTGAEALACGCALVTTACGGVSEYASDGETALMCAPGDEDGLFTGLMRMVQDREFRLSTQATGRARVTRFTWERAHQAFADILFETSPQL